jgi:hypothetical protein
LVQVLTAGLASLKLARRRSRRDLPVLLFGTAIADFQMVYD